MRKSAKKLPKKKKASIKKPNHFRKEYYAKINKEPIKITNEAIIKSEQAQATLTILTGINNINIMNSF